MPILRPTARRRSAFNLRKLPFILGVCGLGVAGMAPAVSVRADVVRVPVAENVRQGQTQELPRKGDLMTEVRSRFGEPDQRTEPVGQPPISQWHYFQRNDTGRNRSESENTDPAFVVYFEHDHVIHSVARPKDGE